MSLQNMGLAALTVFVLAACGGGGSSGPSTASMPTQNPGNTETPENNGGQSSVSDAEVKATKTLSVATLKSINEDALREELAHMVLGRLIIIKSLLMVNAIQMAIST